ncbi:MAG: hypothetical protein IJ033_01500 [Clostridia bacterium]|nr:hypothetical protein [Clostridia bacterium]
MFDDIGNKIKKLAKVMYIIEVLCCVIIGIVIFILSATENNGLTILYGLLILILGPIFAWLATFVLYAFGDLVDNVAAIRNKVAPAGFGEQLNKENIVVSVQDENSDVDITPLEDSDSGVGVCERCGIIDVPVWKCVIKDEKGVHYKKLCIDCITDAESNAEIVD